MTLPPNDQPDAQRTRRRRTTLIAAGAALAIGAGGAGLWWSQRDDGQAAAEPTAAATETSSSTSTPDPTSTSSSSTSSSSSSSTSTTESTSPTSSSSSTTSSSTTESSSSTSTSTEPTSTSSSSSSTTESPSPTSSSTSSADPTEDTTTGAPQGSPSRVVVTSGGEELVDAPVQPDYLDSDGVLAPPFGTVGWYAEPGWPKPGYEGASILTGHINHGGQPDVFGSLPEVNTGDTISVRYDSGDVVDFTITRSESAPKSGVPQDASIWDHDNPEPVLRLITCDPSTSFDDGHYEGNWVVWAELA